MKRKMVGAAGAYMSGLFFASFFSDIYGVIIFILCVVQLIIIAKVRKFSRFDLYIIFLSFFVAFTVSMVYTVRCYFSIIDYDGITGNFSGIVTDYEVYDGDNASYVLKGRINGSQNARIILYSCETGAEYGDTITLTGCDFRAIENDYIFNAKNYYKSSHIFLYVNNATDYEVEYNNSCHVKKCIASMRENIISGMRHAMGNETCGLLAGMIFGEKDYIGDNTKTSFYRSGIGHVLAVSGLHVSIIASAFMWVLRKMNVNKYISFCLVNLLILFFIAFANYPISAIRASIMLDITYIAPFCRRYNDPLNSLAVTSFIINAVNPYAIYSGGFLLSLSGTFGLAVFGEYMTKDIENKYIRAFVTCLCTSFAVMPVSMLFFDEVSLVSPLTNIVIVPLCTVSIVLGVLYIATGGIFTFLLYIADNLIKIIMKMSDCISSFDFAYIPTINNIFPLMLFVSGIFLLCLHLLYSSERITSFAVFFLTISFAVVFIFFSSSESGKMKVSFLGKGNNSVVVISHNNTTHIIDISGHYCSAKYVRKYLFQNGTGNVSSLIFTRKTASMECIYAYELEPFTLDSIMAVNDVDIYDNRLFLLSEQGFKFNSDGYVISYNNNILTVNYGNCIVSISPAKNNSDTDGLSVYYGNLTKSTRIYDNSIFLDDMNNFEVIMSLDGKYKIRSLYG